MLKCSWLLYLVSDCSIRVTDCSIRVSQSWKVETADLVEQEPFFVGQESGNFEVVSYEKLSEEGEYRYSVIVENSLSDNTQRKGQTVLFSSMLIVSKMCVLFFV